MDLKTMAKKRANINKCSACIAALQAENEVLRNANINLVKAAREHKQRRARLPDQASVTACVEFRIEEVCHDHGINHIGQPYDDYFVERISVWMGGERLPLPWQVEDTILKANQVALDNAVLAAREEGEAEAQIGMAAQ